MTLSEQMFLDRIKAIRAPKRANIGVGGASTLADQGPLPDGGNLGQPMQSGVVPGRNRFTVGNSARGNVDLGSFVSARPNQDALAQLSQDPLAPVDPYKATTGFGGFFRRLFGDDANERNEAAAGQRSQLLAKKWLLDQQNQGQVGVLDKQHQYEMERLRAASELNNSETQYRTQLGLQGEQLKNQWALQQEAEKAKQARTARFDELTGIVGDPIKASMLQERMLTAPLAWQEAQTADELAAAQGTGRYAPRPESPKSDKVILPEGSVYLDGQAYVPDENGKLQLFTGQMGGGGFDMAAASQKAKALMAAKAEENTINNLQQPGTAFGGLKTLGSNIIDSGMSAAGNTWQGQGLRSLKNNTVDPLMNYLKRIEEEKKARELMKRGLVNPIPTAE